MTAMTILKVIQVLSLFFFFFPKPKTVSGTHGPQDISDELPCCAMKYFPRSHQTHHLSFLLITVGH